MGRPPLNVKPILVRLPEDMPARIDALVGKNKRAAFIREAIENELSRRKRADKPKVARVRLTKKRGGSRSDGK
jgi:metal-responsive CopG/Arc/MetJ family transcriptional regulator